MLKTLPGQHTQAYLHSHFDIQIKQPHSVLLCVIGSNVQISTMQTCLFAFVCNACMHFVSLGQVCVRMSTASERERVVEGGVGGCGESAQRLSSAGWCDTEASQAQTRPKRILLPSSCLPQLNLAGGNGKVITSLNRVMWYPPLAPWHATQTHTHHTSPAARLPPTLL